MRLHKRIAAAVCSVMLAFALTLPAIAAEPDEHPHVSGHTGISSATAMCILPISGPAAAGN